MITGSETQGRDARAERHVRVTQPAHEGERKTQGIRQAQHTPLFNKASGKWEYHRSPAEIAPSPVGFDEAAQRTGPTGGPGTGLVELN